MLNYILEAEGKTKTDAENTILKTLLLESGDVRFETIDAGKSGFFGITQKKPAIVRAYVGDKKIPISKVIHGVVLTLLKKMEVDATVVGMGDVDDKIYVELSSPESGILIGKRGSTLDSIQFLLNIMIEPKLREGKKIVLDIESYREKREMALVRLARSVASAVAKTTKSRLLEAMNPYERRIIHMTLQKDARVFTRSEGNGTFKRVRVIPMKDRHKYKDVEINKEPMDNNHFSEELD